MDTHRVLLYSDNPTVRDAVRMAVGRRPSPDVGRIEWVECDTAPQVIAITDEGGIDVAILDGEAWPAGGLGLARQLKDELADSPATLVLIARRDDRWLASWSRADGVLPYPLDPGDAASMVAQLLRDRANGVPVLRVTT